MANISRGYDISKNNYAELCSFLEKLDFVLTQGQ